MSMNILILCMSNGYGGLELYARQEVLQLRKSGHSCVVAAVKGSMFAQKLEDESVPLHYFSPGTHLLPLISARKLASLIDELEIDLIHIHWGKDLNLAVLGKFFCSRPVKLVYSRHMAISRSKHDILHRWFYKQVDSVLVITENMRREALKYFPLDSQRIKLLYLGVEGPSTQPACGQFFTEAGFVKRKLNIAVFGRIEHGKGQHVLLDALQSLIKDNYDVSLTIVGHVMDGAYKHKLLETCFSHEIDKHVQFVDFINTPVNQMPCFDVVVLTTFSETFGLVLIEAMRAGVAVIGTDSGGVPEIIENNVTGSLYEPGNVSALASVLKRLYDDENLLCALAMDGKKLADRKFTIHEHFEKLDTILRDVLAA